MRINKYKLYVIVVSISLLAFFYRDIPLIWDYEIVNAVHVVDKKLTHFGVRNKRNPAYDYYMVFSYNFNNKSHTYIPPTILNWDLLKNWNKRIIIQKSKPEHAHLYCFLGIFMNTLTYFLPFLLFITIPFLVKDLIPKEIKI